MNYVYSLSDMYICVYDYDHDIVVVVCLSARSTLLLHFADADIFALFREVPCQRNPEPKPQPQLSLNQP